MRWFLPKNDAFLELFDQSCANILVGVRLFREMLDDLSGVAAKVEEIKEIEHEGDRITHLTLDKLNTTFITPFDREDIHTLIVRLDDILDATDAAASRMAIYRIGAATSYLVNLADLLVESVGYVQQAVRALHDRRRHAEALSASVEINRVENEADAEQRRGLVELFSDERDAIRIIKLKELYMLLEEATDRCEDVANVVETIIIKS
jgi:predicted phosphate transport protein (TIGR00153 family)